MTLPNSYFFFLFFAHFLRETVQIHIATEQQKRILDEEINCRAKKHTQEGNFHIRIYGVIVMPMNIYTVYSFHFRPLCKWMWIYDAPVFHIFHIRQKLCVSLLLSISIQMGRALFVRAIC